ncbi:M20/M25/M40 family metallo-hydrolase [Hymenobacter sp. HDW8]|uniref:M20/M25/M40 family metallo-hydrolase n=1 Tax=Hymenobacter sp. HDW8 TaxID=2714932 RepID=UPI00140CEE02|nr:M20/M25/M40 family metallo-hydrolase [Hymenobacter sp. HDW8]QIL74570.1 M20/M25/M40 family metallo-hydrolase [Hymenobacter sp. HDW8]
MPSFVSRYPLLAGVASLLLITPALAQKAPQTDSLNIRRLYDEALLRGESYENLRHLTGQIGGRLAGSPQAQQAVDWTKVTMEKLGLDRVYLQEVMVPHWVRGAKEKGQIRAAKGKGVDVPVCALGGSVGTGGKLRAQVIEVQSLDELAALPEEKVKGKFVFFNRPMNPTYVETGKAYGEAGDQRRAGASAAAKRGAVGALVRSLSLAHDDFPHTGTMRYEDNVAKVPAAALSTNGADRLSQLLKADKNLTFELEMACQTLPDVKSYNVIGEIKGSKYPDEIITVGGHLDSWDLGQGAHDDGTGCVQSMEVLRLLKATGLRPERTIRAVMFMNEENGNRGGIKYAELAKAANEKHLAAMESDGGGFTPRGFALETTNPATVTRIQQWSSLFAPYGSGDFVVGHGGTDIGPLKDQAKVLIGYDCDSQRYFDIHHTAADTFDKVNRRELELGGASMAALVYLLSKYGL